MLINIKKKKKRRQQPPLGILFDELNALVLRETGNSSDVLVPRKTGDDGLDLVHTDATNGRHRQYFPVNLTVLFVITNHLITLYDHLFDRQTWFSPRFIRFLGKSTSYHCSDDCLAHDNFVNSWPFPQRFLVLVFTYPHPNLDIFSS